MGDINYGVGTLASAFATVDNVCNPQVNNKTKPIPQDRRGSSIGMCVVNVNEAASYIGHAVLSIRGAAVDCTNKDQSNQAASCSSQISGVIQSFSLVAAYLSNAAAQCGDTAIVGAECSNRIGSVVAGMAIVSAGGSATALDCVAPVSTKHQRRPR